MHVAHAQSSTRSRRAHNLASAAAAKEPASPAAGCFVLSASASPTGGPRINLRESSVRRVDEEKTACMPPESIARPYHRSSKARAHEGTTLFDELVEGDLHDRCEDTNMCRTACLGVRPTTETGRAPVACAADWPAQAARGKTPAFARDAQTGSASSRQGDLPAPAADHKRSATMHSRQDDFMCCREDLAFARGRYASVHPVVSFVDLARTPLEGS